MTLRLGLVFTLAMAAVSGCRSQPAPPSLYLDDVEVIHYDVDLSVDPQALTVCGSATITLIAPADRDEMPLTLDGPTVDSILVNGSRTDFRATGARLNVPVQARRSDTLAITVYYRGKPSHGLYRGVHDGNPVMYTDAWPTRAAGWLPGLHHPAHPATLSMSLDVAGDYTVVASGTQSRTEDGRDAWQLDSPAPIYTFAFAAADYLVVADSSGTIPITHYLMREDSTAIDHLARTSEIIDVFELLLGPYPYASFQSAAVPFGFAGMENASTAFLATNLYGGTALEEVLVHEIVHQWIGNDMTIADWRHLWISEGVTTYLTTLFYEIADGPGVADRMRADLGHVPARDPIGDAPLVPDDIRRPDDMLTWRTYRKGAAVMHILRLAMGDERFFDALREVYMTFRNEPATTEGFVDVFIRHSPVDTRPLLDYWLFGDRIPRITTSWDPSSSRLSWIVSDDDGLLDTLTVLLEVSTEGEVVYAELNDGEITLRPIQSRPTVRPVGVTMKVSE